MLRDQIEILLVDDHKVLRDGLRALLESEEDMVVVAEADTGEQAVQLSVTLKPDIIVMDLGLPDISGLDAIRLIRKENKTSRIVVLSMYTRREFVVPALEAGCDGYVPKSSTHTSLLQAIRVVLKGDRFLHPAAATALVESLTGEQSEAEKFLLLSDREQEVLRLSAMGFSSREIGDKLLISPKTVETYRQRAMEKLNLEHRPALIQFALKAGILYTADD